MCQSPGCWACKEQSTQRSATGGTRESKDVSEGDIMLKHCTNCRCLVTSIVIHYIQCNTSSLQFSL